LLHLLSIRAYMTVDEVVGTTEIDHVLLLVFRRRKNNKQADLKLH
jgi:hypothetical protein